MAQPEERPGIRSAAKLSTRPTASRCLAGGRAGIMAGFHDRSDPGPNFSFRHLYELTKFFEEHGRF
jgi:hypothetical protein